MRTDKKLTTRNGAPVVDNQNTMTAGLRGPALLQDVWHPEKLAHFDREVVPERRANLRSVKYNWDFRTSLPEALHQITIVTSDRGIPATYRHMHGLALQNQT